MLLNAAVKSLINQGFETQIFDLVTFKFFHAVPHLMLSFITLPMELLLNSENIYIYM